MDASLIGIAVATGTESDGATGTEYDGATGTESDGSCDSDILRNCGALVIGALSCVFEARGARSLLSVLLVPARAGRARRAADNVPYGSLRCS